jgi:hypothetical protein
MKGSFQALPKGVKVTNFEVLSINPKTRSRERMPFATIEEAESHQRRAQAEGRLVVEIVSSPAEFKEWHEKTKAAIEYLKETGGS